LAQLTSRILNSVVAFSRDWGPSREWNTCATGFIYGRPQKEEDGKTYYDGDIFLVTNRHVFRETSTGYEYDQIWIAINGPVKNSISVSVISLKNRHGKPNWTTETNVDVAVLRIKFKEVDGVQGDFDLLDAEKHCATVRELKTMDVSDGEAVMSVGYPLDLCKTMEKFPIVRNGTLSNFREAAENGGDSFLCDLAAFGGGSGSPLFVRPTPYHHLGDSGITSLRCIGVISGQFILADDPKSQVRKLAKVWTVDVVERLINQHLQQLGLKNNYKRKSV
jgi:hypothetical protein